MGALCCKPEVRPSTARERNEDRGADVFTLPPCSSSPVPLGANPADSLQEIDFEGPVDLWHFYLLRSVGKGAFGKVSARPCDFDAFEGREGTSGGFPE